MHAQMDMMLRQRRLSEDGIIVTHVWASREHQRKFGFYQVPVEKNLYGHFSQLASLPQKLDSDFY